MPVHSAPFGTVETLEWGDGPDLLVLLHAAATGPQALRALAEALAGPGRRVVAPFLDGYGRTRVEGARNPVAGHVMVAAWLLENSVAGRRILFGHSIGGLAALKAASGTAGLDALAVYDPIVISLLAVNEPREREMVERDGAVVQALRNAVGRGEPEAGVAGFVRAWNETDWQELPPGVRKRLVAAAGRLAEETHAGHTDATPATDWMAIRAPTLLLTGSRSPELVHRAADRLASLIPRSEAADLYGLGHMGPAMSPAAVATAISRFLARLPAGAA